MEHLEQQFVQPQYGKYGYHVNCTITAHVSALRRASHLRSGTLRSKTPGVWLLQENS